jgi:hypothetical protein
MASHQDKNSGRQKPGSPARGAKRCLKATPTNPISPLALSREPVIRCLGAPSWRWISYP